MTDAVMCCAKCQQPLKIVCDAHGTDFVPDTRMMPPTEPTRRRMRGTVAEKILAAFEDDRPRTLGMLVSLTGLGYDHVCVEMTAQVKAGTVRRVGRGLYVKAPG